jgi:hypothetical protein
MIELEHQVAVSVIFSSSPKPGKSSWSLCLGEPMALFMAMFIILTGRMEVASVQSILQNVILLIVILLIVILLSVIALNFIMLSVNILSVITLNFIVMSVIAPSVIMLTAIKLDERTSGACTIKLITVVIY